MGAHGSKEKLHRSASERFVHTQVIERERFGSFGKRVKKEGKMKFIHKTFRSSYFKPELFYYAILLTNDLKLSSRR